jgi:hypothetical protein
MISALIWDDVVKKTLAHLGILEKGYDFIGVTGAGVRYVQKSEAVPILKQPKGITEAEDILNELWYLF